MKIVMELALSQVNERTDILPEYGLHMVLNDTKVYTITQGSHFTSTPYCLRETGLTLSHGPVGLFQGTNFDPFSRAT